jgi:hypothetical protein
MHAYTRKSKFPEACTLLHRATLRTQSEHACDIISPLSTVSRIPERGSRKEGIDTSEVQTNSSTLGNFLLSSDVWAVQ